MKKTLSSCVLILTFIIPLFAGTYNGGDGSEGNPYQIATSANLIELSNTSGDWSSYFIQTADIIFNSDSSLVDWDGDGNALWDVNDQLGFLPIGTSSIQFLGTYNGDNYSIINLFINRPTSDNIALFGYCSLANISNLNLTNVNITGNNLTGSLLGYSDRLEVENCHVSGNVTGIEEKTGGLIGFARVTHVNNCHSSVNVYGGDDFTGGLIAHTETACEIRNCYSTGTVTNTAYGNSNGGLIGDNATSTVEYCYTTSDVYAYSTYTAGFAGRNASGTIKNCYCSGYVQARSSSAYIGGFSAYNYGSAEITNCYSSSFVDASIHSTNVGGFLGNNAASVSSCFWDIDSSGKTLGIGAGTNLGASGKTSVEMRTASTYPSTWDFYGNLSDGQDDIWKIEAESNDGYPYLRNTPLAESATPITLISFTAKTKNGLVNLAWSTASETNNASFVIYRNNIAIASINGAGTSSETQYYTYSDNSVIPGQTYTYILADLSYANKLVKHLDNAQTITLGNEISEVDYQIGAAYPNPFNPSTLVPIKLNTDSMVKAALYDLKGHKIKQLADGNYSAGTHELQIDGSHLSTGIYMLNIQINNLLSSQKLILMK